jgi:hypothetical protein
MTDFAHLDALLQSLHREEARLDAAKRPQEKAFREHQIAMKRKEIATEREFLKKTELAAFAEIEAMSTDELLAELFGTKP